VGVRSFLGDQPGARDWSLPDGVPSAFTSSSYFLGPGDSALEIAAVESPTRPSPPDIRTLWKRRQGGTPSPLLLVVLYPSGAQHQAAICGPTGDPPTLVRDLDPANVERIAQAALAEPNRHAAVRFLVEVLGELESELPGLRNEGLLATHELRTGVPTRADWIEACERGRGFLTKRGRELVESLGFTVQQRDTMTWTLRVGENGTATAVAIFLDEKESYEGAGQRFDGNSPVSLALAKADADRLPFVVITRGSQIRLYAAAKRIVGVGRKGRTETFLEVHLALLPAESAGYLPLLFGAEALLPDGSFEEVLERSRNYATDLSKRLRERVYTDVVPSLATAIARRLAATKTLDEADLRFVYEQALFVLFRLVFIAYAEDKSLLPYATNDDYRQHALKTRAQRLADRRNAGDLAFDPNATDLWSEVKQIFRAVDQGNSEWGVPAYDGGLFSASPDVSPVGAAIDRLELSNEEFGPPLARLLVDIGEDAAFGAIDFRSLSVREFGTIYEGLLESSLSIAQSDLTLDKAGTYLPASEGDEVNVPAGQVYLHNQSGARKASGSYFTKEFAVEHLLDHALEPALDDHIARLTSLVESGNDAGAAEAFFDFRVADIAMGSGHFLINAVDHIEARLTSFLTEHPLPAVNAELATLRKIALDRLGGAAEGAGIEQAALVRRQVARRCIYGVDVNIIAVELARLALWIHTFVPGLPLSFLDRTLVCGNSLTGIGSLDEAVEAVEGGKAADGAMSLARDQIARYLERARGPLARLGRISDATPADIAEARQAQSDALEAVKPATVLFNLAVAARLGEINPLFEVSDEVLEHHPGAGKAEKLAQELDELHLPVAFPEVFLRDRSGFDCIVGNPPWEEATVEELGFWALRYPGLKSLPQAQQRAELDHLQATRPDLVAEYELLVDEMKRLKTLLLSGPYPGMGQGDPDLYKAFCWRFWQLVRMGGRIGVVLPRSALSGSGSTAWREMVLDEGQFDDVTLILNNRQWFFDDVHAQYTVALVSILRDGGAERSVRLIGPFGSYESYVTGSKLDRVTFAADQFKGWSSGAAFPLLPSVESGDVFLKLRRHPRLDSAGPGWSARAIRELHATDDKRHMLFAPKSTSGLWPVYKGASFDLWEPDTGDYYAWADPAHVCQVLQERRLKQSRLSRSAFADIPQDVIGNANTLPCRSARVAFRDVTNRTNKRTVITALLPPRTILANQAPYLLWSEGDEHDQAYLLGILSSVPLDWYARRYVETHLNYHVLHPFPVPRPARNDPVRRQVEELAGLLAATDERFETWAGAVGVPLGRVADSSEKADMIAELDAAVSVLYGLEEADVRHIFETFHVGWDYGARLDAVVAHYRKLKATI
jgi:hypothetical protein